ncbi:hypothetical protein BGZ83_011650 [Gryganskiella cystojenkinii]|nr:hypothetical protein BGZ83_011650 [Gryganskiella cystojenkinii]
MLSEKSRQALLALQKYEPYRDKYKAEKRSAVLVALIENPEGELEVILTVRSSILRTNAGDVAFPGGKKDPEDVDLVATARREAFEEVGLPPLETIYLTSFPPILSRHMQVVTPVVAFCPNLTTRDILSLLSPNPDEVDAIFTAPLECFLGPDPPELHEFFDMEWNFSIHRVHRFGLCGRHNFLIGGQPSKLKSSSADKGEEDEMRRSLADQNLRTGATGAGSRIKTKDDKTDKNNSHDVNKTISAKMKKNSSLRQLATRRESGMPSTLRYTMIDQARVTEKNETSKQVEEEKEEEDEQEDEEEDPVEYRTRVGWSVYGLTASALIEVAKVAYQREPDFEEFAPGQMIDQDTIAVWYNRMYGVPSRL